MSPKTMKNNKKIRYLLVNRKKQQAKKNANKKLAEEYRVIKTQMSAVKRKFERVVKAVNEEDGRSPNLRNKYFLQLQMKNIDGAHGEANALQSRMLELDVGDEAHEEFEVAYVQLEQLFGELYIFITELLDGIVKKEQEPPHPVVPAAPKDAYHLPPLKVPLPTFDGSYENWYAFKSMFETVMQRYQFEPSAIKLYHLRNSLVGKAAGIIDQEIINNNDYAAAWVMLTERFEDRRLIIDKHIDALFELPKLTSESAADLRKLIDTCTKNVTALKNLDLEVSGLGESMVINRIASKLDPETRKAWELQLDSGDLPNYESTLEFLRDRCRVLEKIHPVQKQTSKNPRPVRIPGEPKIRTNTLIATADKCPHCSSGHELWKCDIFKKATLSERYNTLRRIGACFNCLQKGHRTVDCSSAHSCKKCKRRHHTLLHQEESQPKNSEAPPTSAQIAEPPKQKAEATSAPAVETEQAEEQSAFYTRNQAEGKQILLSTAVVYVYGKGDQLYPCRVLLDSGSHTNFVSEYFATLLSLKKQPTNYSISGVNDIRTKVRFKIHTKVKSRVSDYVVSLEFLVVPRITGDLPLTRIDPAAFSFPDGIELADPNFGVPDRIDMLLGAEIFYEMLEQGQIQLPRCTAILQETRFGWVLGGPIPKRDSNIVHSFCTTTEENISEIMERFWQVESYCGSDPSIEDSCIQHFMDTHERTAEGRYVVRLPFNGLQSQLGDSRKMAEKRFLALERRLDASAELKQQYVAFMRDYESLEHMKENTTFEDDDPSTVYYLPHHYVLRPSSSTTKLRVVFDGSASSSSGISINQTQSVGPVVQNNLIPILLNFRSHKFVLTLDIPKMYRQVMVHPADVRYLRIVWREDKSQPLRTYDLMTVTYGLASSPFLATMTLLQLATDNEQEFPMAADAVKKSFYMDDALLGAKTVEEAIQLKNEVVQMLKSGGFEAHKFCSNSEEILVDVPEKLRESYVTIDDSNGKVILKTLGVAWNPKDDQFTFVVPLHENVGSNLPTKRTILSEIARIYDPLGFIGPVLTTAKLIMRDLWTLGLDWDEPVPPHMGQRWNNFRDQLYTLNNVKIPRWILEDSVQMEIHGFADASDQAYGACIYTRLVQTNGVVVMTLVCSKSRLLPKKTGKQKEITTPRAELLAAQLLSQLVVSVLESVSGKFSSISLWSDSQIVLCWLRKTPGLLSVYVGNRVREIQKLTDGFEWRYIPSKENPADLISRGVKPKDLESLSMWWNGPPNLQAFALDLSQPDPLPEDELPELRKIVLAAVLIQPRLQIFDRINRFRIIHRSMAYVVRFCDFIRSKRTQLTKGPLTVDELGRASVLMIRLVQVETFDAERRLLKSGKEFKHPLRNLNPFIDPENGILRVGGRLKHANVPYEAKHQALLPEKHPFTIALIRHLHRSTMHIGQRGLLAVVRQQYWPLNAKGVIRKVIHNCVPCFRMKPTKASQLMGELPHYRVQHSPVFAHTGIDFAGPFKFRSSATTRNPQVTKGYVCVFVCMATRALHLEAVSNLTTESFLGALQRFVSRRGLTVKLYSDNATNFEGADNEMRRLAELFRNEQHQRCLDDYCTQQAIEWSFIPPRSPHFGGIWEVGVKSVKFYLKRILAEHKLTYEQMSTALAQIEAILNSRPLTPVSDDPNDLRALTPAHFLIGREFQAIPESSYDEIPQGRLSKWQFVQDLKQKFWNLWTKDYLHELQKRQKDFKITEFKIGALVLIVDENAPPLQWSLGRIIELHPGKDGHTRVVSLKTKTGTTKRAVKKICLLPLDEEGAEETIGS